MTLIPSSCFHTLCYFFSNANRYSFNKLWYSIWMYFTSFNNCKGFGKSLLADFGTKWSAWSDITDKTAGLVPATLKFWNKSDSSAYCQLSWTALMKPVSASGCSPESITDFICLSSFLFIPQAEVKLSLMGKYFLHIWRENPLAFLLHANCSPLDSSRCFQIKEKWGNVGTACFASAMDTANLTS